MNERTYLCPDCDGHGFTGGGRLDVDDYAPEYSCLSCDESGVVHLSREIGEDRGLQPWGSSERGRDAERGHHHAHTLRRGKRPDRTLEHDVLRSMAMFRPRAAECLRQSGDWRFTEYGWIRTRFAMKPVKLPRFEEPGYIGRLMQADPVAAEILGPIVNAIFPTGRAA